MTTDTDRKTGVAVVALMITVWSTDASRFDLIYHHAVLLQVFFKVVVEILRQHLLVRL
jgi:hypothetical protein